MNSPQSEVLAPAAVELDAGPGQRLVSAREAASLSIEEVAARLHLDTRTIRNLETDNYWITTSDSATDFPCSDSVNTSELTTYIYDGSTSPALPAYTTIAIRS